MRTSIMTEKIARRGVRTPAEYAADPLDQVTVGTIASTPVVTLQADDTLDEVRAWIAAGAAGSTHQGFPVLDGRGVLIGVLTRRDLTATGAGSAKIRDLIRLPVRYVYDDCSARAATEHMVNHDIGRLPVVNRVGTPRLVGIITRSDILSCYRRQIEEEQMEAPSMRLRNPRRAD
jgi:CBS domain-containing protein